MFRNPQSVRGQIKKARILKRHKQIEAARLLGVSKATVLHGERDETEEIPAVYVPKIIRFVGYNAEIKLAQPGPLSKWFRRSRGQTAKARARELNVPELTGCAWETS